MAGGYEVPKEGIEALRAWLGRLERQVNELRGSAGVKSAVITDPNSTARIMLTDGQIRIWDDYEANPEGYGLIYTDADGGANLARIFPPHNSGTGLENSVTMRGTAPGTPGAFWMYTDGDAVLDADGHVFIDGGESVDIVTPKLRLYEMGSTGIAANLALEVVAGEPILRLSVSSERYKNDLEPVQIDIDDLRAYSGITWLHQDTLDRTPPPWGIRRNVGHHAEAMAELPTLRQFVNFNDTDEPDSVEDSRFAVAVHEGWKHTDSRVTELERIVQEQAETIAALSARLDTIEST